MLIPRDIREPMVRAIGYLRKDDPLQAMQAMVIALKAAHLRNSLPLKRALVKPIQDFLHRLEDNPRIRWLLDGCVPDDGEAFPFSLGQETKLMAVLGGLVRILQKQEQTYADERQTYILARQRRETLLQTGQDYLRLGQLALAQAFFIRLVVEFKEEEDLWLEPAELLKSYGCHKELAGFYDALLKIYPKKAQIYTLALEEWLSLGEYERAEDVFKRFLEIFGRHPNTLARMARFYLNWGKLDQAELAAAEALSRDPNLAEALQVLNALQGKI
ncbi:MAG: hypothetical protein IJT59_06995 [Desulfovibrionaceae bacterium]|nr:hypothetical protein [Desulfovibrionaceae bacterium]